MKESSIRPLALIKKYRRLQLKEIKSLLKEKSQFVSIPCPACLSSKILSSFNKQGFIYRQCAICKTLYVSPRPNLVQLKTYYQESSAAKYWQTHLFPHSRAARIQQIIKPRIKLILKLIKQYRIPSSSLIDVGAAPGHFGQEVAKTGKLKHIILVDPAPISTGGFSNISVINDVIEHVKTNFKSHIITNFELIEHLFSPDDFITCIHRLLKPDGWFIFTTPNGQGFDLITLNKKSDNIVAPNHLNLYNTYSIKLFLERHGFDQIQITTPGQLDVEIVTKKHLHGEINLSQQPFLHYLFIDYPSRYAKTFQNFLQKNQLSSHMLIIAHKISTIIPRGKPLT